MPCTLAGPLCSLYHSLLRDQGQDTNENELSPVTANAEEEKLVFLFARGGVGRRLCSRAKYSAVMVRASGSARLFAPKNTASVTAETHMAIVLYPSTAYLLPVYNAFIIIFSILFISNCFAFV